MNVRFDSIDEQQTGYDERPDPRRRKPVIPLFPWSDAELIALYRRVWGPTWDPSNLSRFRGGQL